MTLIERLKKWLFKKTEKRQEEQTKTIEPETKSEEKYYCEVRGREISKEDFDQYDGLCWECWDDRLTEEEEEFDVWR